MTSISRTWRIAAIAGLTMAAYACSESATGVVDIVPESPQFSTDGTPNKQDWKQCKNDKDLASECDWVTGNLTHSHNVYREGDFVPKALRIPKVLNGDAVTLVMTYGFLKGGKTTHDFLGQWDATMMNANPCVDGSFDMFCDADGTLTGITATSNSMDALSQTAANLACGVGSPKAVDMATAITNAGAPLVIEGVNVFSINVTGITFSGCPASGDAEALLTMDVTPNADGISEDGMLLLFGAHVARSVDWRNGGAAGVSGSPYHLGLVSLDGKSAGSMDLQMAAAAIVVAEPAAAITIASDATNEVGDTHVITATVTTQADEGEPFLPAPDGTEIQFEIESGPGSLSSNSCLTTGGTGSCTVNLDSNLTGQTVVSATSTVEVSGFDLTVTTDGAAPNSDNLQKTWVDAKISITPETDLNPVGEAHTFTVTLMKDLGGGAGFVAAAGETVTATQAGTLAPVTLGGTCTGGGTTNASGQCTFTYTSNTAGTLILTASSTLTVGGVSLTRSTDGTGNNSGPATKTWGGAWITIGDDATNEVGQSHAFTVTVMRQVGGGSPEAVSGVVVTPTGDVGDITAETCTAGTDSNGQCTITVNSTSAGQASIGAQATVPLNGTTTSVSTDGVAPNSGPATKTWVDAKISIAADGTNPVGQAHTFTVTVWEDAGDGAGFVLAAGETVTVTENGVGDLTGGSCTTTSLGPPGDPQSGSGVTDGNGQCTAVVNSAVAGISTVSASSNVSVGGITVSVSTDGNAPNSGPATKTWVSPGATFLIIDEDGIDNGLHFNDDGGPITPDGPDFFSAFGVNDDKPGERQRDVLRYFAQNVGRTITVRTGQTGDEAWFAPNCIPQKWISGGSNTCLEGAARQTAIANYFGLNGSSAIPSQSRLDKVPAVMPLRALGLNSLIGRDICAVVYDSDISINYNSNRFPYTDGNLQGETLGIVAFHVNEVRTLNGFSSSTLPEVQITILSTTSCGSFELFNAPVPTSSSVPNDRVAPGSPSGYRALLTNPAFALFY